MTEYEPCLNGNCYENKNKKGYSHSEEAEKQPRVHCSCEICAKQDQNQKLMASRDMNDPDWHLPEDWASTYGKASLN